VGETNSNPQKFSGPEKGEEYVSQFEVYLNNLKAAGQGLPLKEGGRPNITKISEVSGVPRQSFYKNDGVKRLLRRALGQPENEAGEVGRESYYRQEIERRDRRIQQLEQRLAVVEAENEAHRRNASRYEVIEKYVIKAGRGIIL
jgi:hypothetical protein